MRKGSISLTEKFVLFFVLIGAGTILVIGLFTFYAARDAIMERTFNQLTSIMLEKKNRVESFFEICRRDIELYNMTIAETFSNTQTNIDDKALEKNINIFFKHNAIYYRVFLIKEPDKITTYTFNKNKESFGIDSTLYIDAFGINDFIIELHTSKQILFRDFQDYAEDSLPVFLIGKAVSINNKESGFVVAQISIDAVNKIMYERNPKNGMGKTGETYLVGPDYLMRSTSRFLKNSVFKTSVNTEGAKEAYCGKTDSKVIHDYRNIPVLSSYSKLAVPGLNWIALAEIDESEAMIPIYSLRNKIILVSLLIAILFFGLAYLLSRTLTRPLKVLEKAARNVGEGNFNIHIPVHTQDEIGSLTSTFNRMALELQTRTEELAKEKNNRILSVIDTQEAERKRLSRELHDGLGQLLIALKMKIESVKGVSTDRLTATINEICKMIEQIVNEARRISNDLLPASLEEFGIINALQLACESLSESCGIDIKFNFNGNFVNKNEKAQTFIFRIVQEALSNAIKHSGATKISVNLSCGKTIYLSIKDNGHGFEILQIRKGNGLTNMEERALLLSGHMKIITNNTSGTEITFEIPN